MEYIYETYQGRSRRRPAEKVLCKTCSTEFLRRLNPQKSKPQEFCSRPCAGKEQTLVNTEEVVCFECGKTFRKSLSKIKVTRHGLNFCSRGCKDFSQSLLGKDQRIRPDHYQEGKYAYRAHALKVYGSACQGCDYRESEKMLDVHHKDSDRDNNKIDNLSVLCVWCHALVTRRIKTLGEVMGL